MPASLFTYSFFFIGIRNKLDLMLFAGGSGRMGGRGEGEVEQLDFHCITVPDTGCCLLTPFRYIIFCKEYTVEDNYIGFFLLDFSSKGVKEFKEPFKSVGGYRKETFPGFVC